MAQMIDFKHPTTARPISLIVRQIFGLTYLDANATVAIIGPGGAMVPVSGTLEEVQQKVLDALRTINEGVIDVNKQ